MIYTSIRGHIRKLSYRYEVAPQERMDISLQMLLTTAKSASRMRFGILFMLFMAAASVPLKAQKQLVRFQQTHRAMGTVFTIDLYAPDEQTATQITNDAFDEVDRLDALLSNYRPSSELSRISREAGAGPVTTDPETFRFLDRSFFWSRQSNGAFDITVGPLLKVWGFFLHHGRVPSDADLAAIQDQIGWNKVSLDPEKRTVVFTNRQAMELDPGSIGKGFAVDRVVALLRAEGVSSAFLSAGGSTLYGIGAPPGEAGWPVNVPDPYHPGEIASRVLLKDESLSTGACTEKFFIQDGHRYCHIFNPRSMHPVEGMLQTTVIDPSATDSDALSTVAFVLRPEASRKFFASMKTTRVLIFASAPSDTDATPRCVAIHWDGAPCNQLPPSTRKDHLP